MATTTSTPTLMGRGRGRGRGLRAANMAPAKPGPPVKTETPPPTPPSAQLAASLNIKNTETTTVKATTQLAASIKNTETTTTNKATNITDIMKRIDNMTESEIMQKILPEIITITEKAALEEFVKTLSAKAIADPSFGATAANLAAKVWDNSASHLLIRNPLLKQTQEDYTSRDKLNTENFYGLCVYVSELFKYLRVKNTPLKPVGDAVVQVLKELMQKKSVPSDEDVLYFYQQLESAGSVIEECLPVKMEEIINIARQMVISAKLKPSIRCRLVQVIELHALKWQMSDELKLMFEDMQQDLLSEGQ